MTNHPIIFSYLMHIKMLFHIQLCMVCVWVLVKGLCGTFTRHLEPHKSACLCALPRTVMLLCAVSNNPNDKVEIRVPPISNQLQVISQTTQSLLCLLPLPTSQNLNKQAKLIY